MSILDRLIRLGSPPAVPPWTIVAVGNPGLENLETRRALGRHLLVRWGLRYHGENLLKESGPNGTLYHPYPDLQVFLPEVTNARLGIAVQELLDRGLPLTRVLLVASDGRLNFGTGRLRFDREMDHPGVQHVGMKLNPRPIARLVFGIGPLGGTDGITRDDRWRDAEMARIPDLVDRLEAFVQRLRKAENLSDLVPVVNPSAFWGD